MREYFVFMYINTFHMYLNFLDHVCTLNYDKNPELTKTFSPWPRELSFHLVFKFAVPCGLPVVSCHQPVVQFMFAT